MRVLHLASFNGNIGDNANHSGFRGWFQGIVGVPVAWTDLEIREFYWRERTFDETFAKLAGEHDLLVVGGGNYFELWVDGSHTGTSIDISPDVLANIPVPIFFNALGCDDGQGATSTAIEKFRRFISTLTSSDRYLVTVRNDGASRALHKYLPGPIASRIATLPDGGFFLDRERNAYRWFGGEYKVIGINVARDMPKVRFAQFGEEGYDAFCDEFAGLIASIAAKRGDSAFVFFPHIHSDLGIISDIVTRLGDRLRRTRLAVAPYVCGEDGASWLFGMYEQCDLVMGMRFHANVCGLGMGIPTLGLCNYPQISHLYDEIAWSERCIDVRRPGFACRALPAILDTLDSSSAIRDRIQKVLSELQQMRTRYEPTLRQWLRSNALISHVDD